MTNVKDRYEFIEEMFEKLGRISVEQIVGRYTKLIPRGRHWMGLCPFHRDTKLGPFIVTPDKGMWKCFSCGDEYAGSGVKFVSLYKNITYLEAAFEIAYEFGLITYDEYRRYYRRKYDELYVKKIESRYSQNQKKRVVRKKVNPVIIHNVYQCMKDCCSLSEHHRLSLIRDRKISLERIEQDYFTCPTNWRQKDTIIARIKEKYPAYTDEILMNIPGFFYDKKRGKLSFTGHKGLGILIRNSDSRIVAIQIRKDTIQEGDSRYIWFSSSFATYNPDEYNGGNGCGSPKDVCYPQMLKKHTLCITEGRFKSEKLTESGNISISVQGVTSWHGIEETIKHMKGIHNVFIFFDADILGKHVLFMQSDKMIRKIQDEFPGLYIRYAFWSKKNGKGIDDCIIAGNISKVKYYEAKRAAEICNDAYTHALGEYHVANLRELKQERAKEFEDYLQILTESMLGL